MVDIGRPGTALPLGRRFESKHRRTENDDWADIESRLRATHAELMTTIDTYEDEDLFTKRRYPWTRSTSIGAYMVSAASSHHAWASKLIRSRAKPGRAA